MQQLSPLADSINILLGKQSATSGNDQSNSTSAASTSSRATPTKSSVASQHATDEIL